METLIHGGFTQREYKRVVQSTKEISNFLIALKEAGQVWRIDYSDPSFPITKVTNVGHILHDGFLSADNKFFYVASQVDDWMAVIDVATMEVVERIATADRPHPGSGAIWTAHGTWYGATTYAGEGKVAVWDLSTNVMEGVVETTGPGLFIRAAENSPHVWADALDGLRERLDGGTWFACTTRLRLRRWQR